MGELASCRVCHFCARASNEKSPLLQLSVPSEFSRRCVKMRCVAMRFSRGKSRQYWLSLTRFMFRFSPRPPTSVLMACECCKA